MTMACGSSILKDQINLKKTSSHVYTVSCHRDWTVGPVLHGGCVAAAIYHAATTHLVTEETLAVLNQPDLLTLHLEFLRACELRDSTITVTELKVGARTSTLQLKLSQGGETKVIALATSINLEIPGITAATAWRLHPPPEPLPDFEAVLAHKPDAHWLPTHLAGEILPFTRRVLTLNPRSGFPVDGVCDAWNAFQGDERMDAAYLALMTDYIPSMSDTLLRNGGLYDARRSFARIEQGVREHPGVPAELTNSFKEARQSSIFNNTVSLSIEFKRRLPKEGIQWMFTRVESRMLEGGRLDLDITICDQKMDLLCIARQAVLVLDARRKFKDGKAAGVL
ncbi:thioesterase family protein [Xylariaceae sp. FL0662B]|nr:thioesterase family protein [Xylariaceae sp. FL0662B]